MVNEYGKSSMILEIGVSMPLDEISWAIGYATALKNFAWWRDGTQYVGSGILTLKEALAEIPKEVKRNQPYPESTRRLAEALGED